MMQPASPRRDTVGVAALAFGGALLGVGSIALWFLLPLAGATLTIALGLTLSALGLRALWEVAR
jgi:hypothetical protein